MFFTSDDKEKLDRIDRVLLSIRDLHFANENQLGCIKERLDFIFGCLEEIKKLIKENNLKPNIIKKKK